MTTVKIESTHPASQGPFVIIDRADYNPDIHVLHGDDQYLGEAAGERVPTMAELLAARDQLLERERELAAEQDRVAELGRANEAEAQRLRDEAAKAPPVKLADTSNLTKDQMQDLLDANGIKYPAAANKAELAKLLTDATA